jgi:hypothetical protein
VALLPDQLVVQRQDQLLTPHPAQHLVLLLSQPPALPPVQPVALPPDQPADLRLDQLQVQRIFQQVVLLMGRPPVPPRALPTIQHLDQQVAQPRDPLLDLLQILPPDLRPVQRQDLLAVQLSAAPQVHASYGLESTLFPKLAMGHKLAPAMEV